jgi:HTH-type transcriptional regulator, competence development regulator
MRKSFMSKEWCVAMAEQEGTREVSAGRIARDPTVLSDLGVISLGERIAFGRLISLLRRHKQYTVEQLADKADVDAAEILSIEEHVLFEPEARTVYRLADTFGLSQQKLMELAGLGESDTSVAESAIRFAARSEAPAKLTINERAALDAFLVELRDKTDTR